MNALRHFRIPGSDSLQNQVQKANLPDRSEGLSPLEPAILVFVPFTPLDGLRVPEPSTEKAKRPRMFFASGAFAW
jgi:hypothetical protein